MAKYLKPQTPLQHQSGDYIYPLTTSDQIIIDKDNRLNSLFKKTIKEIVTLQVAGWSDTKPYTQTITLNHSVDDYDVDANVAYGDEDNAALHAAAGCLSYIKKNNNTITFYCLKKKPDIDLPVEISGTCRNTIADITIEEGVKLNFDIVAYATEEEMLADTPKENTIGVVTTTPITGYKFSATEPENIDEGEVWIEVGNDSDVAFDIVDGAKIYPLSTKQYVGGVLVDVTAVSYQNNEWIPWITELYLYNNGDQCTSVTGGWTKVEGGGEKISFASTKITFDYGTSGGRSAAAYTVNKIDVSKYKTIVVTGKITNLDVSEEERSLTFGLTSSKTANDPSNWNSSKTRDIKGVFEETLDISKVSSSYYVCLHAHGSDLEIYTVSLK